MPERLPNAAVNALQRRAQRDGSRPLLTYLELASGARMELSATTVANWVAKLSWAIDDAGVMPGETVALPVLRRHPTHWLPLVWALGAWAAGAGIGLDAPEAELGVVAADDDADFPTRYVAGSDLWGRDCADVLGFPDAWRAETVAPDESALDLPGMTHADIAALEPSDARRVIIPGEPSDAVLALAASLLGKGSLVLLDGAPTPEVALRIAEAEHAAR